MVSCEPGSLGLAYQASVTQAGFALAFRLGSQGAQPERQNIQRIVPKTAHAWDKGGRNEHL